MTQNKQNNLKHARKAAKMSQVKLGEMLGVDRATIRRWETGESRMPYDMAVKLASALGVSTDYLMGRSDTIESHIEEETIKKEPLVNALKEENVKQEARLIPVDMGGWNKIIKVPVYPDYMSVCAGHGYSTDYGEPEEELAIPLFLLGGSRYSTAPGEGPFIIRVEGDSMEDADIHDGGQALINPAAESHDGDAVMVELFGERMIKWIFWNRSGGGELRSATPGYPVRYFTQEDVNNGNFYYLGKVCQYMNPPRRGRKN